MVAGLRGSSATEGSVRPRASKALYGDGHSGAGDQNKQEHGRGHQMNGAVSRVRRKYT